MSRKSSKLDGKAFRCLTIARKFDGRHQCARTMDQVSRGKLRISAASRSMTPAAGPALVCTHSGKPSSPNIVKTPLEPHAQLPNDAFRHRAQRRDRLPLSLRHSVSDLVPRPGHFSRALMGQFCKAPKISDGDIRSIFGGDETIRGAGAPLLLRTAQPYPPGDRADIERRAQELLTAIPTPRYWPVFLKDCTRCKRIYSLNENCAPLS